MAEPSTKFSDRLLAEAVRALEQDGLAPRREGGADAAGRAAGGDLERRVVVRARSLSEAGRLTDALRHVRAATAWIVAAGIVLSLLAGAGAARAALGAPGDAPVNFFWLIAGLLGLQTLLLVVWFIVMVVRPRAVNVSPLGSLAMAAGRWLAARTSDSEHRAALQATGAVIARGAIGRWSLSAISHVAWTAFNVGVLVLVLLLLSAKHYTFGWETTILDEKAYAPMTRAIAIVPRAVGFEAPDDEQVRASRWTGDGPANDTARGAWSGLLVGSLVCYGLAPRALLLFVSLWRRRRALRAYRLDLTLPGYARLRPALMPSAETIGIIDGAGENYEDAQLDVAPDTRGAGPPALVGYEIEPPATAWPPKLHGQRWTDLGFVDSREDRHRIESELRNLTEPPRVVVIVCSLTTTPDRGTAAFLERVGAAGEAPIALVLTDGDRLRQRGPDALAERLVAWHALAHRTGLDDDVVLELDLDNATDASIGRLTKLVGNGDPGGAPPAPAPASGGQRLEAAFAIIESAAQDGDLDGDRAKLTEVHRRVAKLYREELVSWRRRLRIPSELPGSVGTLVQDGAERFIDALPGALRKSPKWLAAGALAGACGCIAAATLVAPVAISALPAWSALGAGIAGALQLGTVTSRGNGDKKKDAGDDSALGDGLRAVTLFTLLLDLQGHDEATISRVLTATLDSDDLPTAPDDASAAGRWLDEVRHRYDVALAREGRA